jgi:uncharacterized protein
MRVTLLSDTHGHLDDGIQRHLDWADEIWHAGDFGPGVADTLDALGKPVRGVWGNIDPIPLRMRHPVVQQFEADGMRVWMTHIGGYPGHYTPGVRAALVAARPALMICGHSHILKAMPDPALGLLHLNPGAAGKHGFHPIRTLMRFQVEAGKLRDLQVVELGKRV